MRVVLASIALLLAAVTCGGTAYAAAEGKRVILLGTANTNPYIGAWTSTFAKLAGQAGIKVTNLSSNYDASVQAQQVDDAIAQKFDMIVMVYVNDQAVVPALTRAKAAGIPVVLIVTPLKPEYENLFMSYVGTDHAELGRLAGEGMVAGLKAEGKTKARIVAVTGAAQQLNVQMRMAAFRKVLEASPGFELVASEDGKWNTALSEKITGELLVRLNAQGGVDGVFAMADNQATGAIQAIESAGLTAGVAGKGVVVVGSNCMKDGLINIKSGKQFATATQIPTEEAAAAAQKITAYFNGETLKKYELVPVDGITKDNLDKFSAGCSY